jgi:sec-independent protein translocase protein TatB
MFDFGAGELVVIGVVALVAIGPKELPGLLRTVGQAVGKLRRMAGDFQGQFNDAMREAELADAQKMIADLKKDVSGIAIEPNPTPAFPVIVETPDIAQPVDPVALATTAPEPFFDGTEIIEPKRRVRKSKTDVVTAQDEESSVGASAVAIVEEPKQPRSSKKNKNQEDAL